MGVGNIPLPFLIHSFKYRSIDRSPTCIILIEPAYEFYIDLVTDSLEAHLQLRNLFSSTFYFFLLKVLLFTLNLEEFFFFLDILRIERW